jgi:hypothetical protein
MDPETTSSVVSGLIEAGIFGPILVAVGWYVLRLQRELRETADGRVGDAKEVTDRVLALQQSQHEVSQEIIRTQEQVGAGLAALAERIDRLEDQRRRREAP